MMIPQSPIDAERKRFINNQADALALNYTVGQLWLHHQTALMLFEHSLIDLNVSQILQLHLTASASKSITLPLYLAETKAIAQILLQEKVAHQRIDLATLALAIRQQKLSLSQLPAYLQTHYAQQHNIPIAQPKDIILYGFGRIGRLIARQLIQHAHRDDRMRLRAVVVRPPLDAEALDQRASLLRHDSVHGTFPLSLYSDPETLSLRCNGLTIPFIAASSPAAIDYSKHHIQHALLIDNTGARKDRATLAQHLHAPGVAQVLITAPAKDCKNIVMGVNSDALSIHSDTIFSAASCTTNAIAPVLAVIDKHLGIIHGHIETIHAYTNDQHLVDNKHAKARRGRAAALNMVITSTGAATALAQVLPALAGRLTANAVRVPLPNGSLAILHLQLLQKTSTAQLNSLLLQASTSDKLGNQIAYSTEQSLVSSDIIGCPAACIVDAPATLLSQDGKYATLYIWYDNEYGYSCQVLRLAQHMLRLNKVPKT